MSRLLTQEEFCTIDKKARFIAEFGKRSVHKNELNKFKSECRHLKSDLPENIGYMLSELCSEIDAAFGKDKQHWMYFVNQTLYKIKSCGVERDLG